MVNFKNLIPIKKAARLFNHYFSALFLLCLFLIKIPPLYPFFPIKNNIFITYGAVGIIVSIMFLFIIINVLIKGKKFDIKNKNTKLLLIFLIYFAFQTLSMINAFSLGDFLHNYKNILIAGMFLFFTIYVKENIRNYNSKIIIILFAAGIFNFFY